MTQHLDIEELQNLLKSVVEETTTITETLANKASKILSSRLSFLYQRIWITQNIELNY